MKTSRIVSALTWLSRVVRRAAMLLVASTSIAFAATDYSDTWWATAGSESGWGVNFTQNGDFIFATFFIYDVEGKAAWLTAQMYREGSADTFSGGLYRTTGAWFGAPVFTGAQSTPAGTARFTATSAHAGTLVYTADGITVTKSIERQSMIAIATGGMYLGGVSGRRTGCSTSGLIIDPMQFDILHDTSTGAIRIDQLSTSSGALICRIEGKAVQYGKVLLVDNADYRCVDWSSRIRVYNLRRTTTGFEAQWFADGGSGCSEYGNLSGVTQSP